MRKATFWLARDDLLACKRPSLAKKDNYQTLTRLLLHLIIFTVTTAVNGVKLTAELTTDNQLTTEVI